MIWWNSTIFWTNVIFLWHVIIGFNVGVGPINELLHCFRVAEARMVPQERKAHPAQG